MKSIAKSLIAWGLLFNVCYATPQEIAGPFLPSVFMGFDLNAVKSGVEFDSDGIPLVQIWSQDHKYGYNATTTAQWGLGAYDRYTRDHLPIERERAIEAADWLIAHQGANGGFPIEFKHDFPDPRGYHLKAPWYSAVAQGNALSLLVRVYNLTGNVKYRDAATRAIRIFGVPTAQGGLLEYLYGKPWYEETPDPKAPNYIFNGFIFGLLGLDDVYLATGNKEAKRLWDQGRQSLLDNLDLYVVRSPPEDRKNADLPLPWSVYDLQHLIFKPVPNYVTDFYMGIHIKLMQEMYRRTGDVQYRELAEAWSKSLVAYDKIHH